MLSKSTPAVLLLSRGQLAIGSYRYAPASWHELEEMVHAHE